MVRDCDFFCAQRTLDLEGEEEVSPADLFRQELADFPAETLSFLEGMLGNRLRAGDDGAVSQLGLSWR